MMYAENLGNKSMADNPWAKFWIQFQKDGWLVAPICVVIKGHYGPLTPEDLFRYPDWEVFNLIPANDNLG